MKSRLWYTTLKTKCQIMWRPLNNQCEKDIYIFQYYWKYQYIISDKTEILHLVDDNVYKPREVLIEFNNRHTLTSESKYCNGWMVKYFNNNPWNSLGTAVDFAIKTLRRHLSKNKMKALKSKSVLRWKIKLRRKYWSFTISYRAISK